ncbi:MauE/DoxX family redox-associated membrane protein [Aeromonas veronii]|uniref:MauE/DoxX family redox-associated membrane protein n=1 Tax=Aeromonas veronii TaxID=654 RepID=UPI001F3AA2B4|nr:MauE/DoxX family redox-associated membrane protein [Aeromonas veronii]
MPALLRMLARLALGGFFLASAGFKLTSPALFVEQIAAFGLIWPPLIPFAAWGLIALELCAGLAVIANRRWGLWLVIGLLALFIPVLGYGVAIGLDISCGCLGRADLGSLPEAIVRDLLLLTLAGAGRHLCLERRRLPRLCRVTASAHKATQPI